MEYIALLGGGLMLVYLFYVIWEVALFKRVMDDPVKGKMASVACGYVTASLLSAMLGAGLYGFLYYIFATVVIGTFAYSRGMKLRQAPETDDALTDTFT